MNVGGFHSYLQLDSRLIDLNGRLITNSIINLNIRPLLNKNFLKSKKQLK